MGQTIAARAVEAAVCREGDDAVTTTEEEGRTVRVARVNRNKKYCVLLGISLVGLALMVFVSVDQSLQNRAFEMFLDRLNGSLCRRSRRDDYELC